MIRDASKILETAIEFCRNNLDILMIGGVAVIVLIILISCIKYYKDNDDEDVDIDEAELLEIVEKVKQIQAKNHLDSMVEKTQDDVEVLLPPLTARIMADDEEGHVVAIELSPLTSTVFEEFEVADELRIVEEQEAMDELEVVEELEEPEKKATSIESLVEEIATLSGKGVKEVEIKIPGAQVKITYSSKDSVDGQTTEPEEPAMSDVDQQGAQQDAQNDETGGQVDVLKAEDKDHITSGSSAIKFGPDNINIARSGRVYSEEELEAQIRD